MNIYLFMFIYFSVTVLRWWEDSGLQALIWDMIDPVKKGAAEYHWIRSKILILISAMSWFFLWRLSNEWLLSLVFVVCTDIIGIVLYEFRFNKLAHGSWKFHKVWGWKIKLWKIITIAYPKWYHWIGIGLLNLVAVLILGKHLADAISDNKK